MQAVGEGGRGTDIIGHQSTMKANEGGDRVKTYSLHTLFESLSSWHKRRG